MLNVSISLDIQSRTLLQNIISKYANFLNNKNVYTKVMQLLYDDFVKIEKNIFAQQGYPERWAALTPRYLQWKIKHSFPSDIMQLHGRLKGGLTGENSFALKNITPTHAEFGVQDLPYAMAQHKGNGLKGLPARPIIQITEEDKRRWNAIVRKYVHKDLLVGEINAVN